VTTLSVNSTCLDTLIGCPTSVDDRETHISLLRSLFEQDLQITRFTYRDAARRSHEGVAVLAGIRYENFINPLLDDSELLEAVFMKSGHRLRGFLHQPRDLHALNTETLTDALIMSTITGWVDGCKILLHANLMAHQEDPSSVAWSSEQTLLSLSASTNRLDMVQFWLSQREMCDEQQLNLIGHIEDALFPGPWPGTGFPSTDVIQLVLSYLIKQGHEVKVLMEMHELEYCCECARTSLPDTHLSCMLTALVTEGAGVPQHYWPKRKSLYYMPHMWEFDELKLFESFELAGIGDISQENFKCGNETACSPLVYLATQCLETMKRNRSECLSDRDRTVRWLVSRGADLRETWPGTNTTVVHCLAWQSAELLEVGPAYSDDPPNMKDVWAYEDYEALVKEDILDECECACSRSGCDFLSCFWKGILANYSFCRRFPLICEKFQDATLVRDLECVRLYVVDETYEEFQCGVFMRILLDLTLWTDSAARTLGLSRLIHGYIRLFVFSYLEIRHTCCDINRIRHWDDPDYTKRPYPRYSPKELRRINEEDAHLRARLEELVPELISQYDSFGGQLQDFVIDVLIPTMRRTAKELKEEDKTLYAAGRREMGVVMDEYEDESEEEGNDVDKEEADIEEESDDEY